MVVKVNPKTAKAQGANPFDRFIIIITTAGRRELNLFSLNKKLQEKS